MKTQVQRSVDSNDRAETNGQTDRQTVAANCFTIANAVGEHIRLPHSWRVGQRAKSMASTRNNYDNTLRQKSAKHGPKMWFLAQNMSYAAIVNEITVYVQLDFLRPYMTY